MLYAQTLPWKNENNSRSGLRPKEFESEHDLMPKKPLDFAATNTYAADDVIHRCGRRKHSWHLALIWGHGVANFSDILSNITDALPDIFIPYQKIVYDVDIEGVVGVAYSDDLARVGKQHIDSKTRYLMSVPRQLAIFILVDRMPTFESYGDAPWTKTANSRIVDIKWKIRRMFNPKLSASAERDSHGVFSHHHVIHISDTSEGVDEVLKYLHLPSLTQLQRTGDKISTPWHIDLGSKLAVEDIHLNLLKIRCAVSSGKCKKGSAIPISESPHFAFVTGNVEEYVEYYRKGRSEGVLTDDHTPLAFTRLLERFDPEQYPACVCENDGIQRRSVLIVDDKNILLDGAHRSAILLANSDFQTVSVARIGGIGEIFVEPCAFDNIFSGPTYLPDTVDTRSDAWPRSILLAFIQAVQQQETKAVFLKVEEGFVDSFHTGQDVDILVESIVQTIRILRRITSNLEVREKYLNNKTQAHVDVVNGGDFVRFDLYKELPDGEHPSNFPRAINVFEESRIKNVSHGVSLRIPALEHECKLRWSDWKKYSMSRPEKIKHLNWNRANHCPQDLQEDDVTICVIEVPRGSSSKMEISGGSRELGSPMIANYGFVPDTVVSKYETWAGFPGDNDPLDCLVLGDSLPFKSTLNIRILGMILMTDNSETDWKIVGEPIGNPNPEEGVNWEELERWFSEYKGGVEVHGHSRVAQAIDFVRQTESSFIQYFQ